MFMQLKDWAFLGNYEFFNNKLKVLATNDLPPENGVLLERMTLVY